MNFPSLPAAALRQIGVRVFCFASVSPVVEEIEPLVGIPDHVMFEALGIGCQQRDGRFGATPPGELDRIGQQLGVHPVAPGARTDRHQHQNRASEQVRQQDWRLGEVDVAAEQWDAHRSVAIPDLDTVGEDGDVFSPAQAVADGEDRLHRVGVRHDDAGLGVGGELPEDRIDQPGICRVHEHVDDRVGAFGELAQGVEAAQMRAQH